MTITIKDIAKHAGVSIATVSRVINDNYYVSRDIKDKVYKSINELNYYPNFVARSLKNDSTFTIGFLVSDISNEYFTSIAKAIEDVVKKRGYNLIFCSTEHEKKRELDYLKLLMSRKVDALIINTTGENDDFISSLSQKTPVMLLDRKIRCTSYKGDFMESNNIEGGYTLAHHLISLGHRKIGVINGSLNLSTGHERFEGFKRAMAEVGIRVDKNYIYRFDGNFTSDSGYQGAENLMNSKDKPTAIVSMNNEMTIGLLRYSKMSNIRIPGDISVASYGNMGNLELMYIQPSIVTMNLWSMGTRVGEMILERIGNIDINNREIMFGLQLIAGNGARKI